MKKIWVLAILSLFGSSSYSQKVSNIMIRVDDAIDTSGLAIQYFDGEHTYDIPNVFVNNILEIKKAYYAEYATLTISIMIRQKYSIDQKKFLVNDRPASIHLTQLDSGENKQLKFSGLANALPTGDTSYNPLFRELSSFRRKQQADLEDFLSHHKKLTSAGIDTLRELAKKMDEQGAIFLQQHPNSYYSFWFFINQIILPSIYYNIRDTAFLTSLFQKYKTTYPKKYLESAEGKRISNLVEGIIRPLIVMGSPFPRFQVNDLKNEKIDLQNYRGRYVLVDFWATWCPPCLEELPYLKRLKNKYASNKFEIIGISEDKEIDALKNKIRKDSLNWVHIYDNPNDLAIKYGIQAFPTLILLDTKGNVIYSAEGSDEESKIQIEALLNKMEDL